jgi:putative oxidoreductase
MSDAAAWILLVGRIPFILFYLNSGIFFHLGQGSMAIGFATQMRFPVPMLAAWPSGLWLIAGSLSIVLGVWADVGALMLALFVIVAAAWFHPFWTIEDPQQRQTQQQNFIRNATFLGACLIIFAFFTTFGHDLPLTITDPLFDLR